MTDERANDRAATEPGVHGSAPTPPPTDPDPVPPGIARIRDFVNTREIDGSAVTEWWATPGDLGASLVAQGLAEEGARVSADDLALALRVREAVRELLEANAGHRMGPGSMAVLDEAAAGTPLAVRFDAAGAATLGPGTSGVPGALGRVFADIAIAVADGTWPRLKACRNDECRWAYYDASRNRSARWCSMAGCGNRMKGRAYRDRARSSFGMVGWTD